MKSIKTYTNAKDALREIFGYEEFREPQDTIIENVAAGKDGLVVLATGNGKSLCYQIPALMSDGLTVVVTPLISLMKDQVDTLMRKGVPAVSLYGEQTFAEKEKAVKALNENKVKMLYVSPEKLLDEDFQKYLATKNVSRFAVDEAHCVSIWGKDFRSSYTHLGEIIDHIGDLKGHRIQRFGYTATANAETRQSIRELLHMDDDAYELVGSFDRPNLSFYVRPTKNKMESVMDYILQHPNEPTIIYSATIKQAEKMVDYLNLQGILTGLYHGKMKADTKNQVQDAFMRDELSVIVATNAFGMGVDKSNVRHVLHLHMPGNIENFYQEAGRGGRDGLQSNSVVFYSDKDMGLQEFFKNSNYPEERIIGKIHDVLKAFDTDEAFNIDSQVLADYASMEIRQLSKVGASLRIMEDQGMITLNNEIGSDVFTIEVDGDKIQNDLDLSFIEPRRKAATTRINQMVRYCVTKDCRTSYLLRALGEERKNQNCGKCDNCERDLNLKNDSHQKIAEEVITSTLSLINTLSDTTINQNSMVSKVLLGTNSTIVKYGRAGNQRLVDLPEFGSLKNWKTNEVDALIEACKENGFISVYEHTNGIGNVTITDTGKDWVNGVDRPIVKASQSLKERAIGIDPEDKTAQKVNLSGSDNSKKDDLKKWRSEKAKESGHQEMMIISDDQISEISKCSHAISKDDLLKSGISKGKVDMIGDDIVDVVNKFHTDRDRKFDNSNDLGL